MIIVIFYFFIVGIDIYIVFLFPLIVPILSLFQYLLKIEIVITGFSSLIFFFSHINHAFTLLIHEHLVVVKVFFNEYQEVFRIGRQYCFEFIYIKQEFDIIIWFYSQQFYLRGFNVCILIRCIFEFIEMLYTNYFIFD